MDFDKYDFDHDPQWGVYFQNLTIPPGVDRRDIVEKYKKKYFLARVVCAAPSGSAADALFRPSVARS